jgi:hypothetical protein
MIVACDVIFYENKRYTRLDVNSEFYIEGNHWKNSVFDNDVSNEGTRDDLVHEENEMIDQEVRDRDSIVNRSGRTVKIPAYLENYDNVEVKN